MKLLRGNSLLLAVQAEPPRVLKKRRSSRLNFSLKGVCRLNEVVESADCGILLDVNSIYVSSKNHNFN
jgi:uncharacterized protein (UPF0276 family)